MENLMYITNKKKQTNIGFDIYHKKTHAYPQRNVFSRICERN